MPPIILAPHCPTTPARAGNGRTFTALLCVIANAIPGTQHRQLTFAHVAVVSCTTPLCLHATCAFGCFQHRIRTHACLPYYRCNLPPGPSCSSSAKHVGVSLQFYSPNCWTFASMVFISLTRVAALTDGVCPRRLTRRSTRRCFAGATAGHSSPYATVRLNYR